MFTQYCTFDVMTIQFTKANAVNNAQAREAHHDLRRSAGTKRDGKAAELARVKGGNDGQEVEKDAELVLYEFVALLVRIAFQRANPTFGNFGNKRAVVPVVEATTAMLENEVLPRARKDSSAVFRETVMQELSVQAVFHEYEPLLKAYYKRVTEDDVEYFDRSDQMGMEQWLRICDQLDLVGRWECNRESDITGDPRTKTKYAWSLSMAQVKLAFADSQDKEAELGAAKSSGDAEGITHLNFEEWCECLARLGVDKYRAAGEVSPANAVKGFIQNLLGEKTPDQVVIEATQIHAERFDAKSLAHPLKGDTQEEFHKWLECWTRIEIMDMHLWPLWEKEVHDILQPLFKELQLIFLAYTRSISEDSAEDAMEMSMDEFHDFVVDVGLETKEYRFDVMCNQFIKANATNTAAVRAQRMEAKRDSQARAKEREDDPNKVREMRRGPEAIKGGSDGTEVKKDQELVLYEFLNMLVRIAFWRANPSFGLWKDKDGDGVKDAEEVVPVPQALSIMLNELVLPTAKRENSAAFRTKEMKDPLVRAALSSYRPKLKAWYTDLQQSSLSVDSDDKLGFDEWLKALRHPHKPNASRPRTDMCGEWEVEQLSEITADPSAHGVHIKCRLSIPTCKAAFMDSQRVEQLGVGQAASNSDQTVLAFDEFCECIARCSLAKYQAVKQMDYGVKIASFVKNLLGEESEEDCMRAATAIKAERYDANTKSRPLPSETPEEHAAFLETWHAIRTDGLYGWPLWEKEVHDLLHVAHSELGSIFRAYSKSLDDLMRPPEPASNNSVRDEVGIERARPMSADDDEDAEGGGGGTPAAGKKKEKLEGSSRTMSLEEFHDFVVDCRLETDNGAPYKFADMRAQFIEANKSGRGLAGPEADAELEMPEFLGLLVRIAFWRLNPEYGEVTMEHQDDLLPVPQCLKAALDVILELARRDDAALFRTETMTLPGVTMALYERRARLQQWFDRVASIDLVTNGDPCISMEAWLAELETLQGIGTFEAQRVSDIVGDEREGELLRARLSLPQAKNAFVCAQRETGESGADITLDFDELLEAIARCAVDKYRSIAQMKPGDKVRAMVSNLLGETTEEAAMIEATRVTAERFDARAEPPPRHLNIDASIHKDWLREWDQMVFRSLVGFPLWEKEVHDLLLSQFDNLRSIFAAYACSSLTGDADTMDMDELRDFVVETSLEVEGYGWNVMMRQYKEANVGSADDVLELHEFLLCLVRISFFRANPLYGMRVGAASKADATGSNLAISEGHANLKGQGRRGAAKPAGYDKENDAASIEMPLPGCLFDMLSSCVLPLARRDGDQQLFFDEILPSPEVVEAIAEVQPKLTSWYELTSEGASHLSLEQWLVALDKKQMLTDLTIKGHRIRLSEPQARAAFFAAVQDKERVHEGLLPTELAACVVQTAVAKYKPVETRSNGMRFTNGDKLRAFVANLFGEMDEEEVLEEVSPAAVGGEPASMGRHTFLPSPRASAPKAAVPAPAQPRLSPRGSTVAPDEDADPEAAAAALAQFLESSAAKEAAKAAAVKKPIASAPAPSMDSQPHADAPSAAAAPPAMAPAMAPAAAPAMAAAAMAPAGALGAAPASAAPGAEPMQSELTPRSAARAAADEADAEFARAMAALDFADSAAAPAPAPAPAPVPAPAPAPAPPGGDLGPRTAAAVLASLLPADFGDALPPELGVGGESAEEVLSIAQVMEEMGALQPLLQQGLQQQVGVLLYGALDRRGDGTVSRLGLMAALGDAIASNVQVLEFFVEAAREKDGEYLSLS